MKKLIMTLALCLAALPAFAGTCVIGEYAALSSTRSGHVVYVATGLIATQAITTTTSSVSSAAFNASTTFIRVICDTKTFFEIAATPTAVDSGSSMSQWIEAGSPEYFGVVGGSQKIALAN